MKMKRTLWISSLAVLGLALTTWSVAQAQVAPNTPGTTPGQAQIPAIAPAQANPAPAHNQGNEATRTTGDIPGPIDSVHDVQDTLKMAFMAADQNHDGLLSQQEAIDAGNTLIGGLFFSADTNGDGKVTQQEAQSIRQKVMQQNPLLRFVLQRAKNSVNQTTGGGAQQTTAGIAALLDSDNDKALSAPEIRQMVQSLTQATFATADTNHDGQLSPTELNSAVYGAARAGVQAAFQAADADRNNALSKDEFAKALATPTQAAFDVLDANLDGQVSLDEINSAANLLSSQLRSLRIPQAQNSATNLIEQGKRPSDVAPVPNIPVPSSVTNRTPNQ